MPSLPTHAQHLSNVEIIDGQKNPMFAAKDYAKANSNDKFYAITGVRDESDFSDLKRMLEKFFDSESQALILAVPVSDTLKLSKNNTIKSTINRKKNFSLWS